MTKLVKYLQDIEFKAAADYDMKVAPNANKYIGELRNVGAPNDIINLFQLLLRESYIAGVKEGCLLTITEALNDTEI